MIINETVKVCVKAFGPVFKPAVYITGLNFICDPILIYIWPYWTISTSHNRETIDIINFLNEIEYLCDPCVWL